MNNVLKNNYLDTLKPLQIVVSFYLLSEVFRIYFSLYLRFKFDLCIRMDSPPRLYIENKNCLATDSWLPLIWRFSPVKQM